MNASTIKEYTHNNLQLHTTGERSRNEEQSVAVEYDSVLSFKDHLMREAMRQENIFMALSLVHDVQRLNNGKRLLSDWDMAEVKKHFRKNELIVSEGDEIGITEKENLQKQIKNVRKQHPQIEISIIQKPKMVNSKEDIHRSMVKGYLNMLSEQA